MILTLGKPKNRLACWSKLLKWTSVPQAADTTDNIILLKTCWSDSQVSFLCHKVSPTEYACLQPTDEAGSLGFKSHRRNILASLIAHATKCLSNGRRPVIVVAHCFCVQDWPRASIVSMAKPSRARWEIPVRGCPDPRGNQIPPPSEGLGAPI